MATHSWITAADVPPAAWAAMCADMRALLTVTASSGAAVAGPEGGAPVLDADRIAFVVSTPGGGPLNVDFHRAAGSGEVETSALLTGGLVVAALERARTHFRALVTITSDADTGTRAAAERLAAVLFVAGDRSLSGVSAAPSAAAELSTIVARAQTTVNTAAPDAGLLARLQALIGELSDEVAGRIAADTLLSPAHTPLG